MLLSAQYASLTFEYLLSFVPGLRLLPLNVL